MIKQILVLVLLIGGLLGLYIHGVNEEKNISGIPPIIQQSLIQQLEGKTAPEKAKIKSQEIAKVKFKDEYVRDDLRIVMVGKPEWIEVNGQHGIQLFAQAYINGKQLGFGKNGSIDIERFRIFNPPVLVDDDNGDIIREWNDKDTGEQKQRKLKQDLEEAILQSLEHTIKLVGKDDKNIQIGKIGNTTSTFYPDANPETSTVDGDVRRNGVSQSFSTIRSGAGVVADDTDTVINAARLQSAEVPNINRYVDLMRGIMLFDTSSIPDSDTIDSATLSLYGTTVANGFLQDVGVVGSTPASNTALVASDYAQLGTTRYATDLDLGVLSTAAYNDWSFNATGLSNISKTGITKLGTRLSGDIDNSAPNWFPNTVAQFSCNSADETGTANDPKLVVVHSGSGSGSGWEFFDVQ